MTQLDQIHQDVQMRVEAIAAAANWPCRKGCDECCRRLARAPEVSGEEWRLLEAAIAELPPELGEEVRRRIRASAGQLRPVVCPLLDEASGACLVYAARPVACRSYGFYAERDQVLGCARIEAISHERIDIVWGNHQSIEQRLAALGPVKPLSDWLDRAEPSRNDRGQA
jgi:uncharacterized protein